MVAFSRCTRKEMNYASTQICHQNIDEDRSVQKPSFKKTQISTKQLHHWTSITQIMNKIKRDYNSSITYIKLQKALKISFAVIMIVNIRGNFKQGKLKFVFCQCVWQYYSTLGIFSESMVKNRYAIFSLDKKNGFGSALPVIRSSDC